MTFVPDRRRSTIVARNEITRPDPYLHDRHSARHDRHGFRAQHYCHAYRELASSDCIAVLGVIDFCVASGCTIERAFNGFDLNCSDGLTGHLALDKTLRL